MRKNVASRLCAAASCLALLASPAFAQKANQLTNLNGLSPDRAESALTARGFAYADSYSNSMGYTYSYWWQANGRNCISVEAHNRLVVSVTDASASDCHQKASNGNAAAAVGVVAGAAILGALLSHKSHHHQDPPTRSRNSNTNAATPTACTMPRTITTTGRINIRPAIGPGWTSETPISRITAAAAATPTSPGSTTSTAPARPAA